MGYFMIFHPQNTIKTQGKYTFNGTVSAIVNPCLNKAIIKEFWHNFTFQSSTLDVKETQDYVFSIGNTKPLSLDGCDYSININADGICVFAETEKNLICGFMTLIDSFRAVDVNETLFIETDYCQIRDSRLIENRMVHYCVFPETELWELQRFIRFCGALKYTHVVVEFWGMLKYDCMQELSWSHGFTKEQVRPIIQEANDLGVEIIPMFNHWGHASSGRVLHGKHVVLDQNPTLQTYFTEDGWCWDIKKPKVRALMRSIRLELIELCGKGKYFHIGCDEAYNFEFTKENMDFITDYINEISNEMYSIGRKIITWGDMFLYKYPHFNQKNGYTCLAPTADASKYMISRLDKKIMVADWQYDCAEAPVETVSLFQQAGLDTLLCPWGCGKAQTNSVLSTIKTQKVNGVLHTTWHTLSTGMHFVTMTAIDCFEDIDNLDNKNLRTMTASLLRKVMPICGDYEKAGWSKFQISSLW